MQNAARRIQIEAESQDRPLRILTSPVTGRTSAPPRGGAEVPPRGDGPPRPPRGDGPPPSSPNQGKIKANSRKKSRQKSRLQNTAKRHHCHQIVLGRSKTAPNHCRTAQNDPKSLQNAAKRTQINAERSKTIPNLFRTFIL